MIFVSSLIVGAHLWLTGQLTATAMPEPSPTPTLRDDLDPLDVSPGFEGFVVTFLLAAVAIVLFLSMTRRMRRIKYRASRAEEAEAAADVSQVDSADLESGHHDGDEVTGPADDGQ